MEALLGSRFAICAGYLGAVLLQFVAKQSQHHKLFGLQLFASWQFDAVGALRLTWLAQRRLQPLFHQLVRCKFLAAPRASLVKDVLKC